MDFAFCFYVGLTSLAFFGFVLYRLHVSDRRTRNQIDAVLDAVRGLKEALVAAGSGQPQAVIPMLPAQPLQRATPAFAPSAPAEEQAPESGRVANVAVKVEAGGETIDLAPEISARLAEIAGSTDAIPDILKQIIDRGTAAAERATGLAEDEGEEEETTRVMGPWERRWMTALDRESPVFPELKGSEDETPRRRAGLYPVVQLPEPPTGEETEEPTVDEERPTQPEKSGPSTPPKK